MTKSESAQRAVREYPHSKEKLPRGWSYPINRTLLDGALEGLDDHTIMRISFMSSPGRPSRPPSEKRSKSCFGTRGSTFFAPGWTTLKNAGSTWRATHHSFVLKYEGCVLEAWSS